MKLNELKKDEEAVVTALRGDSRFAGRITAIGMTVGARLQVVKNDPKMPVLVYVRETLLALNRNDCERIETEVIG